MSKPLLGIVKPFIVKNCCKGLWSLSLFIPKSYSGSLGLKFISVLLNEIFSRASPLRFPEKRTVLDGRGNCLMPAMPISQKQCFFKNCPKNLTNFGKFKFFLYFLLQFYRAFQWCIICFYTLSGLACTDQYVNQEIRGYVGFLSRLYVVTTFT